MVRIVELLTGAGKKAFAGNSACGYTNCEIIHR
jgi:hypothetical protein